MGQLWNIGTQDDPIIQGQAGKPFYHQMGPLLQFHNPDQQVDNKCLCKYRYARYFAFYSNVPEDKENIVFYKNFNNVQRDQSGSKVIFRDYSTESSSGYSWQFLSGPHYLGCYPVGTFTTGRWFPVDLPYDAPSGSASGNITAPCPSYIHIYKQEDYHSLLCMIVSSYKCCNGEAGCGIQISRGSDSWVPLSWPACAAQYLITGLDKSNSQSCTATLIKGTEQCICTPPYRVQRKFKQLDCSRAIIRVWNEMVLLPGQLQNCPEFCPECFQQLPQLAIATARGEADIKCVWWLLWKWALPGDCDECAIKELQPVFIQDPQQWTYISSTYPEVYGKGPGWMPRKFHDPRKRWDFCSPQGGGVSYQWTYIEVQPQEVEPEVLAVLIAAASPGPLEQNPCKDYCFLVSNVGNISDSLSGAAEIPQDQLPCNTPDPSGKAYKKFTHQFFTVWTLPIQKVDCPDNPQLDPCYDTYKIADSAFKNGELQWVPKQGADSVTDYQLQQKGYFKGFQFIYIDKTTGQLRLPLSVLEEPPASPSDSKLKDLFGMQIDAGNVYVQDYSKNHCAGVYQVYLFDCRCSDSCDSDCSNGTNPYIHSGTCSKWKYIGQVSDKELEQRGCCKNGWIDSTIDNTFSEPLVGPIGWCVYTVTTDQPYYCADYPQGPKKKYYYRYGVVTPNKEHNHIIAWQEPQYIEWEYCQSNSVVFVPGFKLVQDPMDQQTVIEPVDGVIDISSDSLCQLYYYEVYSPFVDDCYEFPSDSRSFFPGLRIQWNLPRCQQWKLYVRYLMTKIQLDCTNWHTGGFPPQGPAWECKLVVMDADTSNGYHRPDISQWNWGWTSNSDPADTQVLQVDNYVVTPPQGKCEVYYLHKQLEYWGGSDSAPSDDCSGSAPQLSPPYIIAWDTSKCLQLTKYVRYRVGTFTPSCSNSAGRAITDQWAIGIYQIQSQSAPDPVSGWRKGNNPGAQSLVVMTDGVTEHVITSDSCTAYYVQILQSKVQCEEPQEWSTSLSIPAFPNTYIDWNWCKCLSAGRTVVFAQASVEPSCDTIGGNKVSWGAVSSHNCSSTGAPGYTPPSSGWFASNGTALDIQGGVVQTTSCGVIYRAILHDGWACGPSTWTVPQSIKTSVQNQSVAWPESCYSHYVHYMVYTYKGSCGQQAASITASSQYSVVSKTAYPTVSEGWKYSASAGGTPVAQNTLPGSHCSFYYIYPFTSYVACSASRITAPVRPASIPQSLTNISWVSSCYPKTWYQNYWYYYYSKGCSDPPSTIQTWTGSGYNSYTVSTSSSPGWYTGSNPGRAARIPSGGNTGNCQAYFIATGTPYSACSHSAYPAAPTANTYSVTWPGNCCDTSSCVSNVAVNWLDRQPGTKSPNVLYLWPATTQIVCSGRRSQPQCGIYGHFYASLSRGNNGWNGIYQYDDIYYVDGNCYTTPNVSTTYTTTSVSFTPGVSIYPVDPGFAHNGCIQVFGIPTYTISNCKLTVYTGLGVGVPQLVGGWLQPKGFEIYLNSGVKTGTVAFTGLDVSASPAPLQQVCVFQSGTLYAANNITFSYYINCVPQGGV